MALKAARFLNLCLTTLVMGAVLCQVGAIAGEMLLNSANSLLVDPMFSEA
jgi:hypothetical protein